MEAKDRVLALLKEKGEPMKAGDIAEALELDKKDVDKAIKQLKTSEEICSPKRCFYAPS